MPAEPRKSKDGEGLCENTTYWNVSTLDVFILMLEIFLIIKRLHPCPWPAREKNCNWGT